MSQVLDPSGFQIQVDVAYGGTRYPLWTRSADSDSDLALQFLESGFDLSSSHVNLPIVESVEVEVSDGLSGSVTVSLSAPYELGIAILSSNILKIGNKVSVRIGYPRLSDPMQFTPWYTGQAKKPSIRISPEDGLSATINVDGGGFAAMRGSSSKTYTGTYRQILREFADVHGWTVKFPQDNIDSDPLDEEREISQANKSNWRFLQEICRSAQCDAFIGPVIGNREGVQLYVLRRKESYSKRPKFTFAMRGNPDFKTVFPVLSFESELEGIWLPRAAHGVTAADINPDTVEEQSATVKGDSSQVPAVGGEARPSTESFDEDGVKVSLGSPQNTPAERGEFLSVSYRDPRKQEQVVESHQHEAQVRASIQATVESFGIPNLFPEDIVRLDNVGILKGNYRVTGVSHRADSSEWMMSVTLVSNAIRTNSIADEIILRPPKTNDEDPPESTGDATTGVDGSTEVEPEDPT